MIPARYPCDGLPWSAGRAADWPKPLGCCRWCGRHGAGLVYPIGAGDGPTGWWCDTACLAHDTSGRPRPGAEQGELFG